MNVISPISFKGKKAHLTEQTRKAAKEYISNPNNIGRAENIIPIKEFVKKFNLTKQFISNFVSKSLIKLMDKKNIDLANPINFNFLKLIGSTLLIDDEVLAEKLNIKTSALKIHVKNNDLKRTFFHKIDLNDAENLAFIEKMLAEKNPKLMTKNMLATQYKIENIDELIKNNELTEDEYGFIDLEHSNNKKYLEAAGIHIHVPHGISRGKLANMLGVNNHTIDYYIEQNYLIFNAEKNYIDINLEKNADFIRNYSKGARKFEVRIPEINSKNEKKVLNGLTLEYCIKNGFIEADECGNVNYNSEKTMEFITKCIKKEVSYFDFFLTRTTLANILKIHPEKILVDKRAGLVESVIHESQLGNEVERFDINSPKNRKYIETVKEMRSKNIRIHKKRGARIKELPKNYIKLSDLAKQNGVSQPTLLYFAQRDCLHILNGGYIDLDDPVNKHFVEYYHKGQPFVTLEQLNKTAKETNKEQENNQIRINLNPNLIKLKDLSQLSKLGTTTLIYHINKGSLERDDDKLISLTSNKTKKVFSRLAEDPNSKYYVMSQKNISEDMAILKNLLKKMLSREVFISSEYMLNYPEIELDKYISYVIKSKFDTSGINERELKEFSSILKSIIIEEISTNKHLEEKPLFKYEEKYNLYPHKRLLKCLDVNNRLESLLSDLGNNNLELYKKVFPIFDNFIKNKCNLLNLEKLIDEICESKNIYEGDELLDYCQLLLNDYINTENLINNLPPRIKKYNNTYEQLSVKSQTVLNNITDNRDILMLTEDTYPDKFVIDILNTTFSPFKAENIKSINTLLESFENEYKEKLGPLLYMYEIAQNKNNFLKDLIDKSKRDYIQEQIKQVSVWMQSKSKRMNLSEFMEIMKGKYVTTERIISKDSNIYEVLNVNNIKEYQEKINNLPGQSINYLFKLFGLPMDSNIDDLAKAMKNKNIQNFNIKQIKILKTDYDYKGSLNLKTEAYGHKEGFQKPYYKFSINFNDNNDIDIKSKIKLLSDFYSNLNREKVMLNSHDTYYKIKPNDFMNEIVYRMFSSNTNEYYFICRLLGIPSEKLVAKNVFDVEKVAEIVTNSLNYKQMEILNQMLDIINNEKLLEISDERHFRMRFLDRIILTKTLDISDKKEMNKIIDDFATMLNKYLDNGFVSVIPQQLAKNRITPVMEFCHDKYIYTIPLNNKGLAHTIHIKKNSLIE